MNAPSRESFHAWVAHLKEFDPEMYKKAEALALNSSPKERMTAGTSALEAMRAPTSGLESMGLIDRVGLESIILRVTRPVLPVKANQIVVDELGEEDRAVWGDVLATARPVIEPRLPAIGRIEVANHPDFAWLGTGWLVGSELDADIVLTNRHVAREFARREAATFVFKRGMSARIDFLEEIGSSDAREFAIRDIVYIAPDSDEDLDVAVLRVERGRDPMLSAPVVLSPSDPLEASRVIVVGYPAFDSRIPEPDLMEQIYKGVYDKKRLAPGQITKVSGKVAEHNATTLGGNSGSVVLDMATGRAVALHFSGRFLLANYAVTVSAIQRLLRERPWQGSSVPSRGVPAPADEGGSVNRGVPASVQPRPSASRGLSDTTVASIRLNVPIEITVRIGDPAADRQTTPGAAAGTEATIAEAVSQARSLLGQHPSVVGVRPGYVFRDGWITDERCIVALTDAEPVADITAAIAGFQVVVRTGALADAESLEAPHRFVSNYKLRSGKRFSLAPVEEEMSITCHVSPEAGWLELKKFLAGHGDAWRIAMYDFSAQHILNELTTSLRDSGGDLQMVIQAGESLSGDTKKDDIPDAETVKKLRRALDDRFRFAWASVTGPDRLFDSSYHIKVAVRDGRAFWLSSGNWQSSNQPPLRRIPDPSDRSVLSDYNREWHAVVDSETLAERLKAHIEQDLVDARVVGTGGEEEAAVGEAAVLVPEAWLRARDEELPGQVRYFEPKTVSGRIKVQPVLTPDNYVDVVVDLIEEATDSILFQNQSFKASRGDARYERLLKALLRKQRTTRDVRIIFRRIGDVAATLELAKDFGFKTDPDHLRVQSNCHTKGIIIDGHTVLLGSHNWTTAGTVYNRDASLLIRNEQIARYYAEVFEFDWGRTRGVRLTDDEIAPPVRLVRAGTEGPPPKGFVRLSWREWTGEA